MFPEMCQLKPCVLSLSLVCEKNSAKSETYCKLHYHDVEPNVKILMAQEKHYPTMWHYA